MIRLFVAIDFPKEVKSQLADLVDSLVEEGYPLVFEKEENFHLTLKFLGWCHKNKLKEIEEAIKKAISGVKPFWFKPSKRGYFLKESLILWIGVEAPAFVDSASVATSAKEATTAGKQEGLNKLVSQLEEEFAKIGFAKEKREFSPHITLARKRRATPSEKWRRIAEEAKNKFHPEFSGFRVKQIILMESTLTPQGSIYTPVVTFPLKGRRFIPTQNLK